MAFELDDDSPYIFRLYGDFERILSLDKSGRTRRLPASVTEENVTDARKTLDKDIIPLDLGDL